MDIKIHKLPVNKKRKRDWIVQVTKGRKEFQPSKKFIDYSNHFVDGKPSKEHLNQTFFLTISKNAAVKRKKKETIIS